MYEIIDDNGTIHSGFRKEMEQAFDDISNRISASKWYVDSWSGDLKLVQVIKKFISNG